MVAEVALPRLFERLEGMRLDGSVPVRVSGWAFRAVQNLHVLWG
jgi:hypothetical protein